MMQNWVEQLRILTEVALAGVLGGLIGLEREWRRKPAGLRTQAFVAGAAALLVALAPTMVEQFADQTGARVQTDPIRIVEAVITGIAFIGAGSIIFHHKRDRLEGVTTAATVLLTAAIGITVALRQYVLAISLTLGVLFILFGLRQVDHIIRRRRRAEKMGQGTQDEHQ